jgi:hypothetical protein
MTGVGANIACCRCGARPYPIELGFPDARQTFDLLRIDGRWLCELHRPDKPPRKPGAQASPIEKARRELARIADCGDFSIATEEALLAVIDRLDQLVEGVSDGR